MSIWNRSVCLMLDLTIKNLGNSTETIIQTLMWMRFMMPEKKRIKVNCVYCGQQFLAKPSYVRRGWAKYCSRSCWAKEMGRRRDRANLTSSATLSYVIGVIHGDGSVSKYKRWYPCQLNNVISKHFAEKFANALKRLGLNPRIYSFDGESYSVRSYSKSLYEFVKHGNWKEVAEQFPLDYLCGFYESEGSCGIIHKRSVSIRIANTDFNKLKFIASLLKKLGFRCAIRPKYFRMGILGSSYEKLMLIKKLKPVTKLLPERIWQQWNINTNLPYQAHMQPANGKQMKRMKLNQTLSLPMAMGVE